MAHHHGLVKGRRVRCDCVATSSHVTAEEGGCESRGESALAPEGRGAGTGGTGGTTSHWWRTQGRGGGPRGLQSRAGGVLGFSVQGSGFSGEGGCTSERSGGSGRGGEGGGGGQGVACGQSSPGRRGAGSAGLLLRQISHVPVGLAWPGLLAWPDLPVPPAVLPPAPSPPGWPPELRSGLNSTPLVWDPLASSPHFNYVEPPGPADRQGEGQGRGGGRDRRQGDDQQQRVHQVRRLLAHSAGDGWLVVGWGGW